MAKRIKISLQKYTPSAIYNSKDAVYKSKCPTTGDCLWQLQRKHVMASQAAIYKTSKNIY